MRAEFIATMNLSTVIMSNSKTNFTFTSVSVDQALCLHLILTINHKSLHFL